MGKVISLLFVDSDIEILNILLDLFKDEPYELYTATKAEKAKNILKQHQIDCVMTDLKLPDGSGSDLLDDIYKQNPETIRILTSGYFELKFGNISENKETGTLYISKPLDIFILRQEIEKILRNKGYLE